MLEKTTPGETTVGTRYREVVQMFPGIKGEISSEITRFEPPTHLEEKFHGAGMQGHLAYEFLAKRGGTLLIQREEISWIGIMGLLKPFLTGMFLKKIEQRLEEIRMDLEKSGE